MSKGVGDKEEAKRGCGLGRNSIPATQSTINSVISTLNQPIQATYSSMLITWHIFPVSLIFPNSDRTPLCFHRPTHPTETTLGVLFYVKILLFYKFHALPLDHWTNPFIEDRLFSITRFELYSTVVFVRFSNYTLLDIRLVTFTFPCPHYRKHFIVGLLNSLVNLLKALKIYVLFYYFYYYFLFPLAFNFPGPIFICYAYRPKSHTAATAY